MKQFLTILLILIALSASAQTPAPVFHGLRMGVPLGLPECTFDSAGNFVNGEPTQQCFSLFDSSSEMEVVEVMVGGQLTTRQTIDGTVPFPHSFVSMHVPNGSNVAAGTVEAVELDLPLWQAKDTLNGLKLKYGAPTSCTKTPKRNAIGIPIPQTACDWKVLWGLIHFEDMASIDMKYVIVRASTNRSLKFVEESRLKREKKARDQF